MKPTIRLLSLAVVGAFVAAGSVAAPVQAAPPTKPVTTGNAVFDIAPIPGVPYTWVTANVPARDTPKGLLFPIDTVSSSASGKSMTFKGLMVLVVQQASGPMSEAFYVSLELNPASKSMDVVVTSPESGSSTNLFFSTNIKAKTSVRVDKAKKTRTTSTIWTGGLRLHAESTQGVAIADQLNALYGTDYFVPGKVLGQIALTTHTTAPCKNAACTR